MSRYIKAHAAAVDRRCPVHDYRLQVTTCRDKLGLPVRTFMSCPECNVESLDRMRRQPGAVTVQVGKPRE